MGEGDLIYRIKVVQGTLGVGFWLVEAVEHCDRDGK